MSALENKPILANPDIVFRQEDDGAFLFNPVNGDLKCLNPIGSVIWMLCDGTRNHKSIDEEIAANYADIPRETIAEDLTVFLKSMLDEGYVGYEIDEPVS
jgi:coenzyme PQQ synthesis protein D (PqqD)